MRLELRGVWKSYSDSSGRSVLCGVDLDVAANEFVAVVGPNGSGKSTLLGVAAGVLSASSGTFAYRDPESERDAKVALLWQNFRESNFPWLNVLENVALGSYFGDGLSERARWEALGLVKRLLPEVSPESPIYQLSGGQQQIVAIARALASEPDLLLGDEPLSALDQARNLLLIGMIEEWWMRRPIPVLWICHNLDEAILLADRIVLLSGVSGRIIDSLEVDLERPRRSDEVSTIRASAMRRRLVEFLKGEEECRLRLVRQK